MNAARRILTRGGAHGVASGAVPSVRPRTGLARRPHALKHGRDLLAIAALLTLVVASFFPGLVWGVVAEERDTSVFYYPLFAWAWQQVHLLGQLPLWAPPVFGGYPIFADGEIGLANPLVLLTLITLPAELGFVLLRALHVAVAAVGCYLLARTWRLPVVASALAGVTFAFGSFFQAQIHHENIIRTAAWLPLMLAVAEQALRAHPGRARVGWTVAAGLAVGMASLSLHIQILVLDLLILAAYALFRWCVGPVQGSAARRGAWWQRARTLLAVFPPLVLLGLALGAVQLFPLFELARFSLRGAGIPYAESAAYSLTPYGLVQLVFPFFFRTEEARQWGLWTHWEGYLYVGLLPLVLVGVALARASRVGASWRQRREVWGWAALGLLGLVFALGQYSPLNLHYWLWLAPGMGGLRAPGRFTLLLTLALAMLAAYGLMWLQRQAAVRRRRSREAATSSAGRVLATALALPLLLALLLGAAHLLLRVAPDAAYAAIADWYLALPRDSYPLTTVDVYRGLLSATDLTRLQVVGPLLGLAALLGGVLLWQRGPWPAVRRWPGWPALLVGATALDLLVFGRAIHPQLPLRQITAVPPGVAEVQWQRVQQTAAGEGPYRVLASPALPDLAPNRLAPLGLQEARGYTSLESRWHRDYLGRVSRVDDDLLDLWNVRYLFEPARYGTLESYQGVVFLSRHALLHAPASELGRETLRVPAGFTPTEIRLVAALVNAVELTHLTPVAEVIVRDEYGAAIARRQLLAGRDVMEWAIDDPALGGAVKHGRVEVAGQVTERTATGQSKPRLLSYAQLPLAPVPGAATIELRNVLPRGELVVYGAALGDDQGRLHPLFGRQKAKYREIYRDAGVAVFENAAAFPRAFVVPRARLAAPDSTSLEQITGQPFNPRAEVLLAADTPPSALASLDPHTLDETAAGSQLDGDVGLGPGTPSDTADAATGPVPGGAVVEKYGLHEVVVRTASPTGGYLLLSDTYYPGWRAFVDGQEQSVLRANMLFRAVPIPPGEHTVEFRFDPTAPKIGLAISLAALALALITLVVVARRWWVARSR